MEFYKSLPSLWRGKIKDCRNRHLKLLPIKSSAKLKTWLKCKKFSKEMRGSMQVVNFMHKRYQKARNSSEIICSYTGCLWKKFFRPIKRRYSSPSI